MLNKKTIIIIISAVLIFFASAALVFSLVKRTGDKATVNQTNLSITDALKSNYPGLSSAQLKFYEQTAEKGNIAPCQGRNDESACISAVALIKGKRDLCHDLEFNSNQEFMACASAVTKQTASAEISRCASLLGDDYYNCLTRAFTVNNQQLACASFPDADTRAICQDLLNYNAAFLSYNRELCQAVKTEKLNQYCLKVIIDKNQDTDGDGLTDLDEINKYKTHYLFADSDNDGVTDGEAVKRGLIKAK